MKQEGKTLRGNACHFYERTGACRAGSACTKQHVENKRGNVLSVKNMYFHPPLRRDAQVSAEDAQDFFDAVYEDWFVECSLHYGEVAALAFSENTLEHLFGNIYIQYADASAAQKCLEAFKKGSYAGRNIVASVCPFRDIKHVLCRDHASSSCRRMASCSYIHSIRPSKRLEEALYREQSVSYAKRRNASTTPPPGQPASTCQEQYQGRS